MNLKDYTSRYMTEKRVKQYISQNKCPVCFYKLDSDYHKPCRYTNDLMKEFEIVDKKETSIL